MIDVVGLWSHLLAAALYGVLALWQLRHWRGEQHSRPLITAFAVMSVWCIFAGLLGPFHYLTQIADSGRNLAFLAFMYGLVSGGDPADRRQRPVKALYAVVSAVIALQIVLAGLLPRFGGEPVVLSVLISTSQMIGLAVAAGALVLVHNLYGQAAPESRGPLRLPMTALAIMWAYDLHLYTAAYLSRDLPIELYAGRGAILALLVPLFALGMRRPTRFKMQLSRAATFQSLSLLAILAYLIVMMSASRAVEMAGGDWVRAAEIAVLVAMSLAAVVLLPSAKARSWANVVLQKHLFQHRYDYRQEWLRFTTTVTGEAALEQRVVKALADIGGASGGLLLLRGADERLVPAGRWNWGQAAEAPDERSAALIDLLEATGHIVDFTASPGGVVRAGGSAADLPQWLARLPDAWAGIPLIHAGRLLGLVVVAHPQVRRALDWEDFDLFRAAGRQAASYLAEAHSLEALAQARRFDEFNRRFAFILHDIKNLVSQLSLVARNAERHAGNPEFRADMVLTLQSSVRKMNDLLARLAPGASGRSELCPRAVALQPLLASIAEARKRTHPVELSAEPGLGALADPAALEQAVGHLVQNAIDASPAGAPVTIACRAWQGGVAIEVRDHGCGMAADFIDGRLFQPFVSTKEGGFGLGAHEARSLIAAMNGRIEVDSRPGAGTRFTIFLPGAGPAAAPQLERISA